MLVDGRLAIRLAPDYGAPTPLRPRGDAVNRFIPAELLRRLIRWQESFDADFHWEAGWRSESARDLWATEAAELEQEVRTRSRRQSRVDRRSLAEDMHNARASNIPLGSIRRDGSLPQRMAGSALICDVRNEKGKAAQAVNGQLGHGPSRRKPLRRPHKERSTACGRVRRAPAAIRVLSPAGCDACPLSCPLS